MGPFDTAFDPLARFQYNFAIGSIVLEGFKAVFIDETKVRPIKEACFMPYHVQYTDRVVKNEDKLI